MKMKNKKAHILGAGPVGLISAWQLLKNGWEVNIYEKQNIVGGMCRTWKWGDFLVDAGPHIFHTPDDMLAKFWETEFGDLFIKKEFWCKNVKGEFFDKYLDYPLSWESISRYPKELKEKILNELSARNPEEKAKAKNYTEYMEAEVGPTLRKMFFEKYPLKIWGITTDEMTPDWAPKRVEFRNKVTPFYHKQWNAVGKYGTGCIYDKVLENIKSLGGNLELNCQISGFKYDNKNITGIEIKNKNSVKVEEDDVIISSLPITITASFFGHKSNLKFRGICSVYLAYDQPEVLPEGLQWLYYDSEKVFFNRITESKKLSSFVAPKDKTFITAEITFSPGDEIHKMDPDQLKERVAEQVELVGLAKKEKLIDISVNWEYFVYPLQYSGYQEELTMTKNVISEYQQLFSLGCGGDFNYADSQVIFHKSFDLVDILSGKGSANSQVIRKSNSCALNSIVNINNRKIGKGALTYIIAEVGLNHNNSMVIAKKLIDEAKAKGCDAVKFQSFQAKGRVSNKVKSVKYAETILGTEETLFEMFDRLSLSFEDHKEIFDYARQKEIEIFSTPFDFESVDLLEKLNVNLYKIASMDLVNLPLIKYVANTGKPIILSTGMSTLGQIEEAVNVVAQAGNPNLMLLHCNSSYPAAPKEMNLKAINTLKTAFNIPVGLSDHTLGLFVSHTAITLGADIIERHFTLSRTMEGPDHILSSEPAEMGELVRLVSRVNDILGDGVKKIQPNEYDTINSQRKSLYAAVNIKKDQIITQQMIAIKGPGGGLLPHYLDIIVGRIARQDIEADFPITWENI